MHVAAERAIRIGAHARRNALSNFNSSYLLLWNIYVDSKRIRLHDCRNLRRCGDILANVRRAVRNVAADGRSDDRIGNCLARRFNLRLCGCDRSAGGFNGCVVLPSLFERNIVLLLQLIALCLLLIEGRARNVARLNKTLKAAQLFFRKFESDASRANVRDLFGSESLSGSKTYTSFGLSHGGLRLRDLCCCLFKTNARISIIEPDEHRALLNEAAQINANGDDFSADRRSDIRLLFSSEASSGFQETRQVARYGLSGRDFNGLRSCDGRVRFL